MFNLGNLMPVYTELVRSLNCILIEYALKTEIITGVVIFLINTIFIVELKIYLLLEF